MAKVLYFVFTFVALCAFTAAKPYLENDEGDCSVIGINRVDCGWLGIDQQTCEKRGCCWDTSDVRAKFCYVKRGQHIPEGQCPVAPSERQECGHYGITKNQCLDRYCCWDDSVPNAKWCFKEPKLPPAGCYIYHGMSGTCRYICRAGERKSWGVYSCKGRLCCI